MAKLFNFSLQDLHSPGSEEVSPPVQIDVVDTVLQAIIRDTITLAFQPIVNAADTDRTAFYEGLIRVPDRNGGILPASEFIDRIEGNSVGRMVDCCALQQGLNELTAQPWLRLSINASPKSVVSELWTATLARGIAADATVAERLIIEVTETTQVEDIELFAERVDHIRELGVSLALDDFGAGFTSFRILQEVRFDIIKIDGNLIRDIDSDRDRQALAKALIDVAKHFDMLLVAEAVESAEEAQTLRDMGVDCLQGYMFGVPDTVPFWREDDAGLRKRG